MTTYTATATRSGKWWVVQCDQYPGAISQVARLAQAAEVHREAIAFVAGVDESQVEVEVRPVLPDDVEDHLTHAAELREAAARANSGAAKEVRTAARSLREAGLTVRDIGTVLGVSYQRAHQLTADDPHESESDPDHADTAAAAGAR
ncbi:hypothetical protein CLV30_101157 [Haloactinopolyspora alba]|uniref:Sigma-70-like protein n=1 Tax=Haloactinopolyspora alba TaxID=648780 RepID=A0A2P8EFF7_9ACTN|nr:hypothetical protein [Haloactinopolyspora alba]PSL08190.1 hypothetical protein CLV30_101157 [Haloactinopolyspora alba]